MSNDYRRALFAEQPRDRGTDSGARAGHDDNLFRKPRSGGRSGKNQVPVKLFAVE